MAYSTWYDAVNFDGLISDINPALVVAAGKIRKLGTAATLKRGTVLAKAISDGKMVVLGTASEPVHKDFTGDGAEKVFVIACKPAKLSSLTVGGTAKTEGTDFTYNPGTGAVTFVTAPANAAAIVCNFDEEMTANCILAEDTEVGTSADVDAPVFMAGAFDIAKCTVKSGYTATEADKDALRDGGIFFKPVNA